jgi:hypothetical protein
MSEDVLDPTEPDTTGLDAEPGVPDAGDDGVGGEEAFAPGFVDGGDEALDGWDAEGADPLWVQLDYDRSVVLMDLDYSGAWDHAAIDVDGDGAPDVLASVRDGGVSLLFDTDGDGRFDHAELVGFEELAEADPELYAVLEQGLEFTVPEGADPIPGPVDYEQVSATNPYWFQQAENGFCVPASVAQIVASYTGVPFVDEVAFVDLANELGLWQVGHDGVPGITMEGAMYLMEHAGVPASLVVSADFDMLDSYLDAGHGVVLFVNSGEVWGEVELGAGNADHALVLTEIDHANGVAILSDPGHPEGDGFTIPIEVLEDAWADGNNMMVVTEQPTEGALAQTPMVEELAPLVAAGEQPAGLAADVDYPVVFQDGGFTPQVNGEPLAGIELHSPIPDAMQWLVQRPWVLLPIAIGASRLFAR